MQGQMENQTYQVDPTNIPKLMTKPQLEYWILFGVCVANKPAEATAKKLIAFLDGLCIGETPFQKVRSLLAQTGREGLKRRLEEFKMGQYNRITWAFNYAVYLDLDTLSIESLEGIPGIGPKTSRMIMLYYDPNCEAVPLDTHILKYLAAMGVPKVPKSTPSAGKTYKRLETAFKDLAKYHGKTVREFDTEVWKSYARQTPGNKGSRMIRG